MTLFPSKIISLVHESQIFRKLLYTIPIVIIQIFVVQSYKTEINEAKIGL